MGTKKFYTALLILAILLAAALVLSLKTGTVSISFSALFRLFAGGEVDPSVKTIIYQLRLPRTIMALVCGCSLSLAGVILQSILKNPLAEPYLLGISSGAGLGVSLYVLLFQSAASYYLIQPLAFAGSIAAVLVILAVAGIKRSLSSSTLILTGVMVSSFCSSVIMILMAVREHEFAKIFFWLLGYLGGCELKDAFVAGGFLIVSLIALLFYIRDMNALAAGDEAAVYAGVNVRKTKVVLIIIVSLLTGVCVSYAGMIGFVGLVVPYLMRLIAGSDHRKLIPLSLLAGSILMLAADSVSRVILAPVELPVGVITALVGVPFFLYIFLFHSKDGR